MASSGHTATRRADILLRPRRHVLLLLLTVASSTPARAGARFFSPEPYTPYEMGGSGPATASDLNGDGRPDLVKAIVGGDVAVRLNLGASGFGPAAFYPVGVAQISLAVGDVTGDGIPDIVTGREFSNGGQLAGEVSVLPGLGDGTFGPRLALAVGIRPLTLAIADVDADGRGDVIAANAQSNSLTLYRSIPTGFGPRTDIPTGTYPLGIGIARLDGDAYPDLAVACYSGRVIAIHRGLGGGAFAPRTEIPTFDYPGPLAAADMDGDSHVDLVIGNVVTNADDFCTILHGNGDGTFAAPTFHGTGSSARAMTLADLDADGVPEIIAAHSTYTFGYQSVVTVLRGADGWSSAGQRDYLAGPDPQLLVATDIDGDLRLDVVAGGSQPYASVLHGGGDGTLGAWSPLPFAPYQIATAAIADINRDGRPDLVVSDRSGQAVGVRLGNGPGTFGPAIFSIPGVSGPQLADLDGDGNLDIVGIGFNGVQNLMGNGLGSFSQGASFFAGLGPNAVAIGDLNGDGRTDLAVTCTGGVTDPRGGISILLGDGTGGFVPATPVPGGSIGLPVLADLNRDGHLDVLGSSENTVFFLLGAGDGTFASGGNVGTNFRVSTLEVGLVNADAFPDVVVGGQDGDLAVVPGHGDGTFGAPLLMPQHETVSSLRIGDVDGDGHRDLVWLGVGTLSVMRGKASGGFYEPDRYGSCNGPPGEDGLAIADLNGDLRPDLASACMPGAAVALFFNTHPDYPTPAQLAVASAQALPGLARIQWHAPAAGLLDAIVERRTARSAWRELGAPEVAGPDLLRFEDRTVEAGERYAYRLVVRSSDGPRATDETWLAIPAEFAFALYAPPQPSERNLDVTFSLASHEPAVLDLMDVSGRRILRRQIGGLGPGPHTVSLGEGRRLSGGLYLIRLVQGARSAALKAVVTP